MGRRPRLHFKVKRRNKIRPDVMEAYAQRNDILHDLGFRDYPAYLRHKLWKGIRQKKLEKEPKCYGCGKDATQVHHGEYTLENLTGLTPNGLYSICGRCHHWIEVTKSGCKRSPIEATVELERIRTTVAFSTRK